MFALQRYQETQDRMLASHAVTKVTECSMLSATDGSSGWANQAWRMPHGHGHYCAMHGYEQSIRDDSQFDQLMMVHIQRERNGWPSEGLPGATS